MSFWAGRNVFVTGVTGLLGGWLAEDLLSQGANVTCLVRDWVPRARAVESGLLARVNCVRGSLEEYEVLLRAINEYEIDSVFHLGAQTIVGTASRSPRSTFEGNVRGTWNLLDACRECPKLIERIIVASSDKAYGVHEVLPYTEEAPLQGRFPYDASKSAADLISLSYYHSYGMPVAITRCGNLYGGGDLNFNRIVPGTIRSALRGESPLIRSDGSFVRDYFYVKDAVEAYLLLAEHLPSDEFDGEAFNFGTETPSRVLDLVDEIIELAGLDTPRPTVLNEASNEIPEQFLDCAKARRMLDWKPSHSQKEGLLAAIAWYTDHLKSTGEI